MNNTAASFQIPDTLNAVLPIELTGKVRDEVNLMVLDRNTGETVDKRFTDIGDYLEKGDVLVLNNSRTIPASLQGTQGDRKFEVRLSRKKGKQTWEALILGDLLKLSESIFFSDGVKARIIGKGCEEPLVTLKFTIDGSDFYDFLYRRGEPIRYEYIDCPLSLDYYQTAYASVPGSVEMPSAGRAFTWKLLQLLQNKGVEMVFLELHAGLSYYGHDRWPTPKNHPEDYHIPQNTMKTIERVKRQGNRVIAVGTTVVRALETVYKEEGRFIGKQGITTLYINKETKLNVVDGLITGFHEPEASHLDLLTAFIDEKKLVKAYKKALQKGYKWHEFGDINLIINVDGEQR